MDKREFQQLIAAVANELPKDWRFDQRSVAEDIGHARAFIIGPRGMGLHFREMWQSNNRGKVHVSGTWPKLGNQVFDPRAIGSKRWGQEIPGINFSPTRKPKTIANDIVRRFLDTYVEEYTACMLKRDQREHELELIQHQVEQLQRVGKLRASPNNAAHVGEHELSLYRDGVSTRYRVSTYSGESTIEMRGIPMELAIKLAALIESHYNPSPESSKEDSAD